MLVALRCAWALMSFETKVSKLIKQNLIQINFLISLLMVCVYIDIKILIAF